MTRLISKSIFLLLALIGTCIAQAQEILPELKPQTVVDDTVVTLDDIFTDLQTSQDLVIANAPDPGQKIQISARHILKVTRAHNVRWRNSAGVKNVIVARMSEVITYTELKPQLTAELKNLYQSDQNMDIRFYNRGGKINMPTGYDVQDLTIKNISLDRNSDKFSALIGAPTGQGSEALHTVNGRTIRTTSIPTLARTIRSGDIIQASDIAWTSIPEGQVSRNMIRNTDKLIGMTPRTQIKQGSPVRLSEVNRPILVERGSLVKINFNTDKISLSTLGKAVEKGGMGDVIQVKNNASQKIVSAIVQGPNLVQVHTDVNSLVLLNP